MRVSRELRNCPNVCNGSEADAALSRPGGDSTVRRASVAPQREHFHLSCWQLRRGYAAYVPRWDDGKQLAKVCRERASGAPISRIADFGRKADIDVVSAKRPSLPLRTPMPGSKTRRSFGSTRVWNGFM